LRRIDQTSSRVELSATRLRELRTTLISAAVTGQIDVKTWYQNGEAGRQFDQLEAEATA